ncbi:transcription factor ap-1 [Plakobranchus ocellatus]|uniref:Transcription factor ap-1 n=1 Tax=Plakobranchus ocellatus TaxID=259542 RepID=A0AAV4ADT1_9GAST|nr:transcription factor ap-1 [Plakobranchus ocellatus]
MEQSLYSDTDGPDSAVKKLKRSMTLDFNSSSATKQKKLATVLASPDLHMLKLASPELEKMIIQANGMVTTTPTPTQFIFPKYVTEEQEAYARGFVDALAELHSGALGTNRGQELSRTFTTLTVPSALSQSASVPTTTSVSLPVLTASNELSTTMSLPGGPAGRIPTTVAPQKSALPTSRANMPVSAAGLEVRIPQIKDEPQTVPSISSTPPMSPINMESQEKIKLERKRARNRVAARKCRTRKLERISRLEDRVKDLKGQNNDLLGTANGLREQVMKLKQQIVEHANNGCQIMTAHDVTF